MKVDQAVKVDSMGKSNIHDHRASYETIGGVHMARTKSFIMLKSSSLRFENLHLGSLEAGLFQDDSPKGNDMALCFIPASILERSRRNNIPLLELLETQGSGMRNHINGAPCCLSPLEPHLWSFATS